ncbi:phosphatase PAP2 family protein [Streptomyces spiralis]|uniref:phosphatase PAP2 family protein n=1 Tax=Streptomyces spiralis TaxID=66376 RepID=UPI0036CB6F30
MSTSRQSDLERAPGGLRGRQGHPAVGRGALLSFLLLFVVVPAALFSAITWQVVAHGPLLRVDQRVSDALVRPDRASEVLSGLGDVQVAVPVLVVVLVHVARRGRSTGAARWWLPPLAAGLLMALLPALLVPLKEWTARHGTDVMPPGVGYYPSGHTATAATGYGAAALVLLPWLRAALARAAVVVGCAVLVLGVSYGLVRRGYHWPLDVVASWCLCAVLLSVLWLVIGGFSRSSRRRCSGTAGSRTGPS